MITYPSEKKPELNPLNTTFEVDLETAERMFEEGSIFPSDRAVARFAPMRSTDGHWIVRREGSNGLLPVEDMAEKAKEEFLRLQNIGINVISRGITFSPKGSIFVVSPYIPNLTPCSKELYEAQIAGKIDLYVRQSVGSIALYEAGGVRQYSVSDDVDGRNPFLHDVDPLLDVIPEGFRGHR